MAIIEMVKKPGPTDFILKVSSTSLEEKEFLSTLYDRRSIPVRLTENPDGSVTIEFTY